MARSYQTVVIGGGPGGYVAAIRLGQLGIKAAVIEREHMGGVCLNWGCIPSKALIHVADLFDEMGHSETIGLSVSGVKIDVDQTRKWKDKIVKKLTSGVAQLVKANGVEIIEGEARFKGPGALEVTQSDGTTEEIQYENCIIAVGARPIEIPGFAFDQKNIWSAKEAVDLPEIPKRLVVIGGGVIGLELGTVYAKLGTELTVVEMTEGLLPGVDRELVKIVERRLKKLKVRVLTSTRALGAEQGKKAIAVGVETKDGKETLEADRVLVAVGFRPNSDRIAMEAVGVAAGRGGAITVNERMETSVPGVFAIGDVTGGPFLAHRAFRQGEIAAEVIAGQAAAWDVAALPAAIFTDPEIATSGLSEEEAKAEGHEYTVGRFHFAANGRALGTDRTQGFVKAIVGKDGVLLGVHIVGAGASDLISEATLGLEMGVLAEDLGLTIHPHPTLSEAVQEAVLGAIGNAIHQVNR